MKKRQISTTTWTWVSDKYGSFQGNHPNKWTCRGYYRQCVTTSTVHCWRPTDEGFLIFTQESSFLEKQWQKVPLILFLQWMSVVPLFLKRTSRYQCSNTFFCAFSCRKWCIEPVTIGSEPVTVGFKPVTVGSEPATVGSEPATVGSKPIIVVPNPPPLVSNPSLLLVPNPSSWFRTRHCWFQTCYRWFRTRHCWFRTHHRWFRTRHC